MADVKISDLPAAAGAHGAQQFEVNDGGNSRRVTLEQMWANIKGQTDNLYTAKTAQFKGAVVAFSTTPANWSDLVTEYPYTGMVEKVIQATPDNHGPYIGGDYWYVYQFFHHTNVTQLAIPYHPGLLAWRGRNGDDWQPWKVIDGTSAFGRTLMKAADAAAALAAIGAGTGNSNLAIGSTATTAKAGDWKPDLDSETTGQLPWARLSGIPDGAAGLPQALGVGSYVLASKKSASNTSSIAVGGTAPGSDLYGMYFDTPPGDYGYPLPSTPTHGPTLSGTWRNMGAGAAVRRTYAATVNYSMSLFLRIA